MLTSLDPFRISQKVQYGVSALKTYQEKLLVYLIGRAKDISKITTVDSKLALEFPTVLTEWRMYLVRHYHPGMYSKQVSNQTDPSTSFRHRGIGSTVKDISGIPEEFDECFDKVNVEKRPAIYFFNVYLNLLYLSWTAQGKEIPPQEMSDIEDKLEKLEEALKKRAQQYNNKDTDAPERLELYLMYLVHMFKDPSNRGSKFDEEFDLCLLQLHSYIQSLSGNSTRALYLLSFGCHMMFSLLSIQHYDQILYQDPLPGSNQLSELLDVIPDENMQMLSVRSVSTMMTDQREWSVCKSLLAEDGGTEGQRALRQLITAKTYRLYKISDDGDEVANHIEAYLYQLMIFPGLRECYMFSNGSITKRCYSLHRAELEAQYTMRSQLAMNQYEGPQQKRIFDSYNAILEDYPLAIRECPECQPIFILIAFAFVLQEHFQMQYRIFLFRYVVPFEALMRYHRDVTRIGMKIPLFIHLGMSRFALYYQGKSLLSMDCIANPDGIFVLIDEWMQKIGMITRLRTIMDAPWLHVWKKYLPAQVDLGAFLADQSFEVRYQMFVQAGLTTEIPKKIKELTEEEVMNAQLEEERDALRTKMMKARAARSGGGGTG